MFNFDKEKKDTDSDIDTEFATDLFRAILGLWVK